MPRGHLIDLATELVKLIGSLTPIPPVDDEGLRQRFVDLLAEFHARAVRAGYADDQVDAARSALVALSDERVSSLAAPIAAAWAKSPLRRQTADGAQSASFMDRLARLRPPGSPERADVLEVFHLCLCLGFTDGHLQPQERQRLAGELASEIRAARSGATSTLSPAWEPRGNAIQAARPAHWHGLPLWCVPAALGLGMLLWWLGTSAWTLAVIDRFISDFPVR